jgi:hypothetical protein
MAESGISAARRHRRAAELVDRWFGTPANIPPVVAAPDRQ